MPRAMMLPRYAIAFFAALMVAAFADDITPPMLPARAEMPILRAAFFLLFSPLPPLRAISLLAVLMNIPRFVSHYEVTPAITCV